MKQVVTQNYQAKIDPIDQALLEKRTTSDPRVLKFMSDFDFDLPKVRANLSKFANWLEEIDRCVGCPGLHACRQKTTGYTHELSADPILMTVLTPCVYEKKRIDGESHLKNYLINDMGPSMAQADVTRLIQDNDDKTYFFIAEEVYDYVVHPQEKGLYLHGQPGVGKSHLAAAMTNYFAKNGKRVAFLSVPSLAQKIKNAFDDPDYIDSILSTLRNVPILVMDDIGAESVTSWFRDEILFPILNARMELKKSTWFTSNESLESLKNHYMYNQRGEKEEMKAIRIMERIEALAKPLFLGGKNRRRSE